MLTILRALLSILVFHTVVHAADRIRIGFPDLAAPFVSLAVGQKRGFCVDEGFQPEFMRLSPGPSSSRFKRFEARQSGSTLSAVRWNPLPD